MQSSVLEWLDNSNKQFGDKIAVYDNNGKITYKQYHDKAIGLAKAIIESGIQSKEPVVVYMDKSADVLISFMGIAYAGDFYSPIDIDMPRQRVNKILEVLCPKMVIT